MSKSFWVNDSPGTWRHGEWSLVIDDQVQLWRTVDRLCSPVVARTLCQDLYAKRWGREVVQAMEVDVLREAA